MVEVATPVRRKVRSGPEPRMRHRLRPGHRPARAAGTHCPSHPYRKPSLLLMGRTCRLELRSVRAPCGPQPLSAIKSQVCSASGSSHTGPAKTVWTQHRPSDQPSDSIASGAADAVSVADFHIPEAPPVPDSEIRRRKDNKPDRFRLPQGPDMKYRLLFKCELCPCRTTRADAT